MDKEFFQDKLTAQDYIEAEKNGIKPSTLEGRFYQYGWSKERCINEPLKRGLYWQHEEECKKNGVSYDLFYARRKKGWTVKQSASTPMKKRLGPKEFAIAESNGISKISVKNRVNLNKWSIERAITEPINTKFRRKQ